MAKYAQVFSSIAAAVAALDSRMAEKSRYDKHGTESHSNQASAKWDGGTGYANALDLLAVGWPEGAKRLAAAVSVDATTAEQTEIAPAFIPDIAGAYGFAQAALNGDPECFYRYEAEPITKPVIRLAVSVGIRFSVDHSDMLKRAQGYLLLINSLEASGVRVELWLTNVNSEDGCSILNAIRIKEADQSVDLNRLAFLCGHGATHRRLVFGLIEKACIDKGGLFSTGCYGGSLASGELSQGRKIIAEYLGDDVHLLPCYGDAQDFRKSAKEMAKQCVRDMFDHGVINETDRAKLEKAI